MILRIQFILLCGGLLLFRSAAFAQGQYQQTRDGKTFVWNETPKSGETAAWKGSRDKENHANGFGELTCYNANGDVYALYYGNMVHGKFEGAVNAHTSGRTSHAYFVDGGRVTGWSRGPAPSKMKLPEEVIAEKRKAAAERAEAAQKQEAQAEAEKRFAAAAPETATKPKPEPEKRAIEPAASEPSATPAAATPPTVVEEKITPAHEKTENTAPAFEPTPMPEIAAPETASTRSENTQPSSNAKLPTTEPSQPSTLNAQPSAASDADVSLSTLVGPPSSLRPSSIRESSPERSTSPPSNLEKISEAEAINLADTEARLQGYHLEDYQRPRVDHSEVKGKWSLFYGLKEGTNRGENGGSFSVTVEDKTRKVEIGK
jgi:hypothetical protein